MKQRFGRVRAVLTVLVAWGVLVGGGVAGGTRATAAGDTLVRSDAVPVAPGVEYGEFRMTVPRGVAHGHLLTVDLADPRVSVDLLYPEAVGARWPVSELAAVRGAVGAVNGDFFHINETQHPGVEATGAPVGPAVAAGRGLKGAVPDGQRFGPVMPPGASTEDVIGVGYDRRARLDRLTLRGAVRTAEGTLPLRGLNQYALPVDGIGAYTARWGLASRVRATCGTDADRAAPCSAETAEVTVSHGRVVALSERPGGGGIAPGSVVLVGREEGARQLRELRIGDPVSVGHRLVGRGPSPLRCAVGGFPIVRDDRPVAGLDTVTAAVRTAAGTGGGGRLLYLMALDGAPGQAGLTVRELADLMAVLGARDAVDLDGGGSSTLVTGDPYDPDGGGITVRNHPSGGVERPVPNAIGVFSLGW
ncbi:phosphodiester glycosidase family protein [Streptomyces piniterrae]|uniref:Phosphodiester glycosidase family protein n=1 Tax=Streptomyces piniterrae TaxID=2571125 RepID=A0A4U0NVC7_9ACTN|nr:phosphodiester glycosidase family protein [Streptomyces piniterrae]TJZ58696.1 phosphodiester glycosidase family protein [Streptomyces piniterrae]